MWSGGGPVPRREAPPPSPPSAEPSFPLRSPAPDTTHRLNVCWILPARPQNPAPTLDGGPRGRGRGPTHRAAVRVALAPLRVPGARAEPPDRSGSRTRAWVLAGVTSRPCWFLRTISAFSSTRGAGITRAGGLGSHSVPPVWSRNAPRQVPDNARSAQRRRRARMGGIPQWTRVRPGQSAAARPAPPAPPRRPTPPPHPTAPTAPSPPRAPVPSPPKPG